MLLIDPFVYVKNTYLSFTKIVSSLAVIFPQQKM